MRMIVGITTIVLTVGCSSTAPSAPGSVPVAAAKPAAELEITTFEMKYLRVGAGGDVETHRS